jgi:hypothetical protein
LAVANQLGLDSAPTPGGEKACPNHGGGAEWLGGAYDPATNYFVIPVTQECGIFKPELPRLFYRIILKKPARAGFFMYALLRNVVRKRLISRSWVR